MTEELTFARSAQMVLEVVRDRLDCESRLDAAGSRAHDQACREQGGLMAKVRLHRCRFLWAKASNRAESQDMAARIRAGKLFEGRGALGGRDGPDLAVVPESVVPSGPPWRLVLPGNQLQGGDPDEASR